MSIPETGLPASLWLGGTSALLWLAGVISLAETEGSSSFADGLTIILFMLVPATIIAVIGVVAGLLGLYNRRAWAGWGLALSLVGLSPLLYLHPWLYLFIIFAYN